MENNSSVQPLVEMKQIVKRFPGVLEKDSGEIYLNGDHVEITSPQDPLEMGLRFIYQELNLVPELDIARNMFLGMEPRSLGFIKINDLYDQAAYFLKKFHMPLDHYQTVGSLSVTQQKRGHLRCRKNHSQ